MILSMKCDSFIIHPSFIDCYTQHLKELRRKLEAGGGILEGGETEDILLHNLNLE